MEHELPECVDGPQPGTLDENGRQATLHRKSGKLPVLLTARFADGQTEFLLEAGKPLLAGTESPLVTVNGCTLQVLADAEVVCWNSDSELDFLELEYRLEEDVLLHRHYLLARREKFLLIGDSVIVGHAAAIDYRLNLDSLTGHPPLQEEQNQEIYLRDAGTPTGLIMPLSLSEWKSAGQAENRLELEGSRITLRQSAHGRALYAPLWINLAPQRCLKPRTWWQLTVGESLKEVPRDIAVAFRVAIGKRQWVVYRSLGESGNRTFLGENQTCEFFVGRFRKGGTKELLSVQ